MPENSCLVYPITASDYLHIQVKNVTVVKWIYVTDLLLASAEYFRQTGYTQ